MFFNQPRRCRNMNLSGHQRGNQQSLVEHLKSLSLPRWANPEACQLNTNLWNS